LHPERLVSGDAEGQREQRRHGEARAAEERSGGEAEIVEEIAEPAGEPYAADFLPQLGEAELDSDAAIRVTLELAVEAALQGPATEPVKERDHRLPSSKIRLTALERRAQLSFSTASWRRPAGVRE
jgi:hypothetical protein